MLGRFFSAKRLVLGPRLGWHQPIRPIVRDQQAIVFRGVLGDADPRLNVFVNESSGRLFTVASASLIDFSISDTTCALVL